MLFEVSEFPAQADALGLQGNRVKIPDRFLCLAGAIAHGGALDVPLL